jgi:hypothetical protein
MCVEVMELVDMQTTVPVRLDMTDASVNLLFVTGLSSIIPLCVLETVDVSVPTIANATPGILIIDVSHGDVGESIHGTQLFVRIMAPAYHQICVIVNLDGMGHNVKIHTALAFRQMLRPHVMEEDHAPSLIRVSVFLVIWGRNVKLLLVVEFQVKIRVFVQVAGSVHHQKYVIVMKDSMDHFVTSGIVMVLVKMNQMSVMAWAHAE